MRGGAGHMGVASQSPVEAPAQGLTAAYLSLYGRLKASLTRRTGSAEVAEDLVQDAYLRLAAKDGVAVATPEAYVWRTVGNLALDYRRGAGVRGLAIEPERLLDAVPDPAPSAERRLTDQARLKQVLAIIPRLPPRCREVFVLRKLEGLDQAEIAARLGVSRNMVEKHLRRALEIIAEELATEA